MLITGTITALGVMAFSHSGTLLLAFPIIMLYGTTMVMTWTVASALIQSVVPDALRGRIAALSVMTHAFFPMGTLFVGGLAQLFGAPMAAPDFRNIHPRCGTCDSGCVSQPLELPGRRQPGRGRRGYGR